MTGPSDLSSRVRAAIEETMRIAQKVPPDFRQSQWSHPGPWIMSGTSSSMHDEVARVADRMPMPIAEAIAEHIALQNPQATLRRCEADLRTLDRHTTGDETLVYYEPRFATTCVTCESPWPCEDFLDRASAYGVPVEGTT